MPPLVQPGEAKPALAWERSEATPQSALPVQPASYVGAGPELTQTGLRSRSVSDISVDPCFDHAADYSWLTGRLEYLYVRNVWRIRYAGCDEDDRFGGGLTLSASFPSHEFKDGQLVHVEGQVLNPEARDRDGGPRYQVRIIQVIRQP
jgi:hypothetical protein